MEFLDLISHIKGILTNEKNKKLEDQLKYQKEISELPKGRLVYKETLYGKYFSLQYYCNDAKKARVKYIGNNKDTISDMQSKIDRRRYLEKELRTLKMDLITIDRMINLANKHIEKQTSIKGTLKEISSVNAINEAQTQSLETDKQSTNTPPNNPDPMKKI
ncbi:MAG: hypothetical protein FWH14_00375 [Oscillospiraceae bacterium]|nr:hypothetical protein [Oscillospiraceae bacterium]